jgi:predicted aldo/keto reductase-like oxidoreductase
VNDRKFGKLDFKVSALGFGAMRFPEKNGSIEEEESSRMLYYAIDNGVNYIDTAWSYHKEMSERFVGKTLHGRYRGKVNLATKLPCWLIEKQSDCDTYLNEQLKRLKTDHIEFYLLHGLFSTRWQQVLKLGILNWAEKAVKDGRIGCIGFSFHGTYTTFKEIIDYYSWDFCQIQYNYLNEEFQAGTKGLKDAAAKGMAIVVMEPLLGGILANPKGTVKEIWERLPQMDPVDVALRWLWSKPEVSTVLSGMSSLEQVKHNVRLASSPGINGIGQDELNVIKQVSQAYELLSPIPCTRCEYCMPCPNGINIPRNFDLYNQAKAYNNLFFGKSHYNWHTEKSEQAGSCTECALCEEKCPQGIKISELMPVVHETLVFKEGEV